MQDTTDTAATVSARRPNHQQAKPSAGSMAMTTSSMMERVVSLPRMWGEVEAMSFRFL